MLTGNREVTRRTHEGFHPEALRVCVEKTVIGCVVLSLVALRKMASSVNLLEIWVDDAARNEYATDRIYDISNIAQAGWCAVLECVVAPRQDTLLKPKWRVWSTTWNFQREGKI